MEKLLTIDEVAEVLACSQMTVRRLIWKGELRAVRVGWMWRIRPEDLEAYLNRQESRTVKPVSSLGGG